MTDPPFGILKDKNNKVLEYDILDRKLIKTTVELFTLFSSDDSICCLASSMESIGCWREEFQKKGWNIWGIIYTYPCKYNRGGKNNNVLHKVYIFYKFIY